MSTFEKTILVLASIISAFLLSLLLTHIIISIAVLYSVSFITQFSFIQNYGFIIILSILKYTPKKTNMFESKDTAKNGFITIFSYLITILLTWGTAFIYYYILKW